MRMIVLLATCALSSINSFASPAHSPPKAAVDQSGPPSPSIPPSTLRVRDDAPKDVKAAFYRALQYRSEQIVAVNEEHQRAADLLAAYEKAIIAPSLRSIESPKFTNKNVWAFRSKKDKDDAIASLRNSTEELSARLAAYSDSNYLPQFDSIPISEIVANAEISGPDNATHEQMAAIVSRSPVRHNLTAGWTGRLQKLRLREIRNELALVDVLANVKVKYTYYYHPQVVDGRTSTIDTNTVYAGVEECVLVASIAQVVVDREIVGNAAIGQEIDVAPLNFIAITVDGFLCLSSPKITPWIERIPTTQPAE